jgi:hypothetical protein
MAAMDVFESQVQAIEESSELERAGKKDYQTAEEVGV